jgi:putative sulfotransferase
MSPLTIIVGTGRCGSTLLSDALGAHPRVLSLSEFFVSLSPFGFLPGEPDGERFWRVLAEPRLKPNTLIRNGRPVSEFRYLEEPGRFPAGRIPAVSLVTLPALVRGHDELFDELAAEVPTWPAAPMAGHYARLFAWLSRRLGRTVVVERSGGSLRFLPDLARCFPQARFVHLHRSGPDCALSMSRHPSFRLAVLLNRMRSYLGVDPYHHPSPEHAAKLPPDLRRCLPDTFDANALDADIPLSAFGAFWSHQLISAHPQLAALTPERLLTLRYESLLADPVAELTRFARFAALPDAESWAHRASRHVDPRRSGASAALEPAERSALERACAPGERVLRRLDQTRSAR